MTQPNHQSTAGVAGVFDQVLVINLDRRKDRWDLVTQELHTIRAEKRVTRIAGIDIAGPRGCFESHLKALDAAIDMKAKAPLVLEDDVLFVTRWDEHLRAGLEQLPDKWDVLYLGYSVDPTSEEARVVRFHTPRMLHFPKGCFTTHAYAVNPTSIRALRQDLAGLRSVRIGDHQATELQIDQAFMTLSSKYRYFGIYPMPAIQRDGYSDIWREERRYRLQENMDHLLRSSGLHGIP